MKSGKVTTADALVSRYINWPHELVYDEISLVLFVNGYLIVMEGEKHAVKSKMASHLQDLMADTELYGCDKVRALHAVWLNKLEQG